MEYKTIRVRPIAGALGAEISGIDLSQTLDELTIGDIRQALLDYLVIFFHDQDLTSDQFITFAKYFGGLDEYPFVKGLKSHPEIIPVIKLEHETVNFGGIWHSDTVYLQKPPMGTLLHAKQLPPVGGDTLFSNMYLAYETLSDGMKDLLRNLTAVNSADKAAVSRTRADRISDAGKDTQNTQTTSEHPVIRTHPETGRKALYVNVAHTVKFKGMTEAESAPLLNYLYQHQTRPEFTCRLVWKVNMLTFWDNRAVLHNPINDYHGYRREMHRIILAGDRPF